MNILLLKKGTAVEVKEVVDLESALPEAANAIKQGYTAEYFEKHSDLKFETVSVVKTLEQEERERKLAGAIKV